VGRQREGRAAGSAGGNGLVKETMMRVPRSSRWSYRQSDGVECTYYSTIGAYMIDCYRQETVLQI